MSRPHTVFKWTGSLSMKECSVYHLGLYLIVLSKLKLQELWNIFKDECHKCLQFIPSKKFVPPFRHPWINNQIKRLSNRKRNQYNKAHSSQLASDWKAFKDLKLQVQRECCNAHDSYVSKLINDNNSAGNKRFWSHIKSKRNTSPGYLFLKKTILIM